MITIKICSLDEKYETNFHELLPIFSLRNRNKSNCHASLFKHFFLHFLDIKLKNEE